MDLDAKAVRLARAWDRRPSRAAARALDALLRKKGISIAARGQALIPLGEAAELDCDFALAHAHFVSVVATTDPLSDERTYARAAARCLLNTPRLQQMDVLHGVAKLVERLRPEQRTPRMAWLGALARGILALIDREWDRARKSFEAAMGAAWESADPEAEAFAHHLLGQTWVRLGRVARAKEHVEAAAGAARRSGLWLLETRLALERLLYDLAVRVTTSRLAELKTLIEAIRKTGYPRLESIAWSRLAQCVAGHDEASTFLDRAERLVRNAGPLTPDRLLIRAARTAVRDHGKKLVLEKEADRALAGLAKLARR